MNFPRRAHRAKLPGHPDEARTVWQSCREHLASMRMLAGAPVILKVRQAERGERSGVLAVFAGQLAMPVL